MAKGLTLDIGANTREAVVGAKYVADGLDDVAAVLDDLAKDGPKAGDKLEAGMRDAQKATEKTERSFKDLADAAKKESKKAGDDIGKNIKRGTDSAGDSVKEVGDEAASTAKETAASFDGSADSIVGAFQEVAANAFAGFGPAGAIAGLAAAAGIGLVTAAFTAQKEQADELAERFGTMYQEAIDEGRNYLSESQIIAAGIDLMWNTERVEEYKMVQEEAAALGVDVNLAIRARAGDEEANNQLIATGKKLLEDVGGQLTDNDKTNDAAAGKRFAEVNKAIEGNRGIAVELDKNKALVADTNALLQDSTERQRDTAAATRDTGAAVDGVAGKINALPDKTVRVNVDTATAETALTRFMNRERTINFKVTGNSQDGRKII